MDTPRARYPIKNYRGLSPHYREKRWAYVYLIRGAANPSIIYLRAHLRFTPRSLQPNQELSVLYGGPTLNYGGQLSLYFPHMLHVNMTRDLAHLQLSNLQGEIRPIYRTYDLIQGERILIRRT